VADADEALRRKPSTPEMMHNLACVFALACTKVQADPKEPDAEKLAAGYRKLAMKLVHATLALVPAADRTRFWREQVLPDSALAAVRDLPEFKQLGQQLGETK